jgi:hypothetical protein
MTYRAPAWHRQSGNARNDWSCAMIAVDSHTNSKSFFLSINTSLAQPMQQQARRAVGIVIIVVVDLLLVKALAEAPGMPVRRSSESAHHTWLQYLGGLRICRHAGQGCGQESNKTNFWRRFDIRCGGDNPSPPYHLHRHATVLDLIVVVMVASYLSSTAQRPCITGS